MVAVAQEGKPVRKARQVVWQCRHGQVAGGRQRCGRHSAAAAARVVEDRIPASEGGVGQACGEGAVAGGVCFFVMQFTRGEGESCLRHSAMRQRRCAKCAAVRAAAKVRVERSAGVKPVNVQKAVASFQTLQMPASPVSDCRTG